MSILKKVNLDGVSDEKIFKARYDVPINTQNTRDFYLKQSSIVPTIRIDSELTEKYINILEKSILEINIKDYFDDLISDLKGKVSLDIDYISNDIIKLKSKQVKYIIDNSDMTEKFLMFFARAETPKIDLENEEFTVNIKEFIIILAYIENISKVSEFIEKMKSYLELERKIAECKNSFESRFDDVISPPCWFPQELIDTEYEVITNVEIISSDLTMKELVELLKIVNLYKDSLGLSLFKIDMYYGLNLTFLSMNNFEYDIELLYVLLDKMAEFTNKKILVKYQSKELYVEDGIEPTEMLEFYQN